jgi:hypothetical protein
MASSYSQSLLLLSAAIVLVLLVACGNVAGLLLARGSTCRHQVIIDRVHLVNQGSQL